MGRWGTWGSCGCCGGTPISGVVHGCGNFGVGATVEIKSGATSYGVVTSNSAGNYAGTVTIPATGTYTRITTILGTDPYAARFVAVTDTVSLTLNASNSLSTVTLTAATGFHCSIYAYFPLPSPLKISNTTDAVSAGSANFSINGWILNYGLGYPGTCGAHPTCTGTLSTNKQMKVSSVSNALLDSYTWNSTTNQCPGGSTGPLTVDQTVTLTVNSLNPFNATAILAAGNTSWWYCGASTQYTVTE